ncbi:MAG: alpha/beta hydrolase [Pseudomonadales bacterium]|nr:alpha/beta hydrolase [Pseudomonadales bacterium]
METILESIALRGQEAVLLGLKQITKSADVKVVKDIPYGELARQHLDLYIPTTQKPRYTLMFIHGGGWRTGHKDMYGFLGHALAKRGIATMVINYRLYPEASYPEFVNDAALALGWLETSGAYYGLSQAPLFLMGHSAGAHIAMLSTMDESFSQQFGYSADRIKGIISMAGVYSFCPEKSELYQKIFPIQHSGENYADTKPLNFVADNGVPIYILHGRQDKTVACRSAERMYKNALLANHPVFIDVRENYGHTELLFEFVDYWPKHKAHMTKLDAFMRDCCL